MKLTLFWKGLILILIPMIILISSILIFKHHYDRFDTSRKHQDAAIGIGKMIADCAELMVSTSEVLLQRDQKSMHRNYGPLFEMYARLTEKLEDLRNLDTGFDDLNQSAKRMGSATQKHVAEFGDMALGEQKGRPETGLIINAFQSIYRDMAPEIAFINSQSIANTLNRSVIFGAVIGIATLLLAAAIALGILINQSVVRQVRHLESNFDKLARNEPLPPPLKGADEVANFDRTVHGIVHDVSRVRRERTEYLEIMSHSMREPLLKLQATLQRLEERHQKSISPKGVQKLEASSRTINRLIEMLNELIDFEQIEQGTFVLSSRDTTSSAIIEAAIECIVDRAASSQIAIEHVKNEIEFRADPDRLVQVLVNLLTNAIKFSPKGTKVTVACEQDASGVTFSVKDQGPGIPHELQSKIFERFEQVDQKKDSVAKKGTGLGLAICKIIVEAHEGSIWIESIPDEGSTFKFSIPAREV